MKKIFLIASILVGFISNAQVAVGTVKDGVLIPFSPAATTVNDNAITTSKIADAQVSEAKIDVTLAAKINNKAEASDVTTLESEVADKATKTELEEANSIQWYDITSNSTLTKEQGGGLFLNVTSSAFRKTIPTQASGLFEGDVVYTFQNNGTGETIIQPQSGLTLQSKKLSQYESGSIARKGSDNWIYIGSYWSDFIETNLVVSNASNPSNEANNNNGFVAVGSGLSVDSASPILGSYSTKFLAVSGSGGERLGYMLDAVVSNSDNITVSFDYIATTGATMTAWQGLSSTTTKTIVADGTLHSYSENVVVSDATIAQIRWYAGTTVGNGWIIDNFKVVIN